MRVEIWSDVICPWCYIGKRRFDTAVANLRARGIHDAIDVVFRSYQLDPRAPDSPSPAADAYAKKFGGPEAAQKILSHVTSVAAGDGITFNMDIAQRANTLNAHRSLHYAYDNHGPAKQAELKDELLQAYFTDGKDIGDLNVLADCAANVGLDRSAVLQWLQSGEGVQAVVEDIQAASDRGITAVPSFVINDQFVIPGAQDVEMFENVLERCLAKLGTSEDSGSEQ